MLLLIFVNYNNPQDVLRPARPRLNRHTAAHGSIRTSAEAFYKYTVCVI